MGIRGGKKAVKSFCLGILNPRLQADPLQETGAFPTAFCFHGQVLVAVGGFGFTRLTFMRRHQKLTLYWIGPVAAGSSTDLPLPKAEAISCTDGILLITYSRKGKKATQQL